MSARTEILTAVTTGRSGFAIGALTAVTLAVVSGCSAAAVPAAPPGQPSERPTAVSTPSTRPTLYASAKPESSEDNDFVDGANDSEGDEEPTFSNAELADQVERSARGFVATSLTRGYPAKNDKAIVRRTEQLMTPKASWQRADAGPASKELYRQHERVRAEVSSVNCSLRGSDRARAKVGYRLVTERDEGGTWRTVTAGVLQEQTLELVDRAGEGWLVSSVS